VVEVPQVMEGTRGEPARMCEPYDLEMRRRIDGDLTRRSCDFMRKQAAAGQRFFLYVPLTQLHFPTLPHRDFEGRTRKGDFADSLVELDARVGQLLDTVNELGLDDDTLFIFASDNGPEYRRPWRGSAGMWTGTYHTAMEGALRVPLVVRWPRACAGGARDQRDRARRRSVFDDRNHRGRAPPDGSSHRRGRSIETVVGPV
jgi:arylsulfatase A-like enzyme